MSTSRSSRKMFTVLAGASFAVTAVLGSLALAAPANARTIPSGTVDGQRTTSATSLGDITITRQLDRSSPKLMEACALGRFN
jgi:hypothetical protein